MVNRKKILYKILILLLVILTPSLMQGQAFLNNHPIYALEKRLVQGDKSALFEIAKYFDNKKEVVEYFGHEMPETPLSLVAKWIVQRNCIFTASEITITDSLSSRDFLNFLTANKEKISFSSLADAFLITPLESRTANVAFREISEADKKKLQAGYSKLLSNEWIKHSKADSLIRNRDPKALLSIASELYKNRSWFNTYNFNQNEFIELLKILMGNEIAVEDERKELTWHIDKSYRLDAYLNLLIYFAGNYQKFRWDSASAVFLNEDIQVKKTGREEMLFSLLNSKSDATALDAFIQLTTADPIKVGQLADEYERARIDKSWAIPIFPYPFLKQLVVLTGYCKQNNIDFTGTAALRSAISKLDSDLSFPGRRKLEDSIINNLSLEDITAFEYWSAIHEQSWGTTYSSGRILDIFYSRHWNEIVNNDRQLKLFLEKSFLFEHLSIIGACNNYLKKFISRGQACIAKLDALQTKDKDILYQIEKAKSYCLQSLKLPNDTSKIGESNRDYNIVGIPGKTKAIKAIKDHEKREAKLIELLSQISYEQVGEALREIENIKIKERSSRKYSFMERDFGFFLDNDFDSRPVRKNFLQLYNKLSEYDLYAYYLNKAGIEYKNGDGSLNYDKIFDILKYNVVDAFVGGGGGRQDNEVYAVIKILELTHKTTLGYPKKKCNSRDLWYCDSQDRADEWMQFLITKKLLNESHDEPVSFHYK